MSANLNYINFAYSHMIKHARYQAYIFFVMASIWPLPNRCMPSNIIISTTKQSQKGVAIFHKQIYETQVAQVFFFDPEQSYDPQSLIPSVTRYFCNTRKQWNVGQSISYISANARKLALIL